MTRGNRVAKLSTPQLRRRIPASHQYGWLPTALILHVRRSAIIVPVTITEASAYITRLDVRSYSTSRRVGAVQGTRTPIITTKVPLTAKADVGSAVGGTGNVNVKPAVRISLGRRIHLLAISTTRDSNTESRKVDTIADFTVTLKIGVTFVSCLINIRVGDEGTWEVLLLTWSSGTAAAVVTVNASAAAETSGNAAAEATATKVKRVVNISGL